MRSNIETRLRHLEAKSSHRAQKILVVTTLDDAKGHESYQRGLVDIVIATGVPRCPGGYPGKDRAPEDSK
jgi:hypothetical protein